MSEQASVMSVHVCAVDIFHCVYNAAPDVALAPTLVGTVAVM